MAVLVMPLVMAIGAIKAKIIAMANGRINMAIMVMTNSQLEFTFGGQNHEFPKYGVFNTFN